MTSINNDTVGNDTARDSDTVKRARFNIDGIVGVYYREMQVLRTRFMRSVVSSMVSPALFLIAFGYGIGRFQSVGEMNYLEFLFAGLIAMATLNSSYGINTEINIARFYFKTFDEYLIAPIPRWHIVVGECLYGVTKGAIPLIAFGLYAVLAQIKLTLSFTFIVILILHMTLFSLLGFIVALWVKNHGDQFAINTFIITPMTFLSGVFFPVEQAPLVLRWIVQIFPLTHSVKLLRSSLSNAPLDMTNLAVFLVFLVVLFILALMSAKRTEGG